jgi:hypothetical protein
MPLSISFCMVLLGTGICSFISSVGLVVSLRLYEILSDFLILDMFLYSLLACLSHNYDDLFVFVSSCFQLEIFEIHFHYFVRYSYYHHTTRPLYKYIAFDLLSYHNDVLLEQIAQVLTVSDHSPFPVSIVRFFCFFHGIARQSLCLMIVWAVY